MKCKIGDKIKFKTEKQRYTVRARDERFIIATKPFNLRKTYLYTLVDLKKKKRSSDDWHCKYDYENEFEARLAIRELNDGTIELSSRQIIDLDIERVDSI